jgi:preflagellin peptidase FlaK
MDVIPIVKIAVSFLVLLLASRSDWKTRMASDSFWIVLGGFGMLFLALKITSDGVSQLYLLFLVPLAVIFFDTFWDRKGMFEDGMNPVPIGLYLAAFIILGALIGIFWQSAYLWELMTILVMFAIIIFLYQFNMIKGGADAKALLALSIVFPVYPVIDSLPLIMIPVDVAQYAFPFSLLILFNAALLTIVVPIGMFFYNLARGSRKLPVMFFGYRMTVSEARKKFVWPLEYVVEGGRKLTLFPKTMDSYEEVYDALEKSGADTIWVTPKMPFLIPMTISILFSSIVGNIIFLFVR